MTRTWLRLIALLAVVLIAACGSSSSKKSSKKSSAAAGQTMTVTPDKGLTDGQKVQVSARGFTPGNKSLGVNECADKGNQTGANDCNLEGLVPVQADSKGRVEADYVVKKGPFGGNQIVCSAQQKCLISVSELTQNPKEVASVDIGFGG